MLNEIISELGDNYNSNDESVLKDILDEVGALPKAVRLNNAFVDRLVAGNALDEETKDKIKSARCEITENKTIQVIKADKHK